MHTPASVRPSSSHMPPATRLHVIASTPNTVIPPNFIAAHRATPRRPGSMRFLRAEPPPRIARAGGLSPYRVSLSGTASL